MLTVPLLVLAGVPGTAANGSNRVGILTSNAAAARSFRKLGVDGLAHAAPVIGPVVIGSLIGSVAISQVTDEAFETAFGLLMVPLIILTVRRPPALAADREPWSRSVTFAVFLGIGLYGGAVQAGVGLVLLAAPTRPGYALVSALPIMVLVTCVVSAGALPVVNVQGQVHWAPALVLAVGLTLGGWLGPQVAVRGGERLIRVAMVVAALALAVRLVFF